MVVVNHQIAFYSHSQVVIIYIEVLKMLKNLKLLRTRYGISQSALALAIGVSQQSINKYENHNIEPDIETLVRMADFFNTSVDFLVGHSSIRNEEASADCLSEAERILIDNYRALNNRQKEAVNAVIDSYTY